jgi:hypothetical protein
VGIAATQDVESCSTYISLRAWEVISIFSHGLGLDIHTLRSALRIRDLLGAATVAAWSISTTSYASSDDWRGPRIQNLRILVCQTCYDQPQMNGQRTIILPPDPIPIMNPRPDPHMFMGQSSSPDPYQSGSPNTIATESSNPIVTQTSCSPLITEIGVTPTPTSSGYTEAST